MAQRVQFSDGSDPAVLLDHDEWEAVQELIRTARGVIRTAHPEVGKTEVVPGWWGSMKVASDAASKIKVDPE
jgi:hypothetical protein